MKNHCLSTDHGDAYIEIERAYSQVLQIANYRIVIVLQPLANHIEITIVRPIVKLGYDDYTIDPKLSQYILHEAKGVLIAGSPWEWKTTFTQAYAAKILEQWVIMKTIEAPRDLSLPAQVTQYSLHYSTHSEIRDILLLSRPDYSVLDEIRNKEDFLLYKDLRLTGIWLIGVIHAHKPVDAIQRLMSAVDIGLVAQVIDTVIFIKAGRIDTVLRIAQVVKVPAGMQSDDLARPVVLVENSITWQIEFEIYTFSDHVVVMPMSQVASKEQQKSSLIFDLAIEPLQHILRRHLWFLPLCSIESSNHITLYLPDSQKGAVIGRNGATIKALETELGLSISIRDRTIEHEIQDDTHIPTRSKKKKRRTF
jgi:ATPase